MTDDHAITEFAAALDVTLFERVGAGEFHAAGTLPPWCPGVETLGVALETAWLAEGTPAKPIGRELNLEIVPAAFAGKRYVAVKRLPAQLIAAQDAKNDFLSLMSHEIRTPLNAVIGMADVLSGTPLSAEQQRHLEALQRNSIRLLDLLNDLLELTRLGSGPIELHAQPFAIRETVAAAVETVESMAAVKGLAVEKSIAPETPVHVMGDSDRLRQVLVILLRNAVKFTESGGLQLSVGPEGEDFLRFAVEDSGIGIAAERLDGIFESFTQGDASSTRKFGGAGVGLTIAMRLVERMGGRIWVESTEAAGSTFRFTVPFGAITAPLPHATVAAPGVPPALPSLAPGMHILLADDSEDSSSLILSYLKRSECVIDVADNGEAAAKLFRNHNYDVVIMDVEMPLMDGYEATREIRRFERETGAVPTPVLALTAHDSSEIGSKGIEAGFTELLTKPIRKVDLLAALRRQAPAPRFAKRIVRVQAGMEDVVPGYLAKRRAEIPAYKQAFAAGDFEAVRVPSHKLKGTGAGYGFPLLTQFGAALEDAAKRKDTAALAVKIDELERYLDSVELEYSK